MLFIHCHFTTSSTIFPNYCYILKCFLKIVCPIFEGDGGKVRSLPIVNQRTIKAGLKPVAETIFAFLRNRSKHHVKWLAIGERCNKLARLKRCICPVLDNQSVDDSE